MKFKKLTIQNIASIEEATIDFDKQPLCDSEVFLITGKTGSGKSSILDAISLALYGKTPRMENTQMNGDTAEIDQSVRVDDVRQLMRRNTAEARAQLSFEGNNGVAYEASWSIRRARGKVGGKLQSVSRSLTRLSDNRCFEKLQDINQELSAAIGLDFNQFCRTTMLAQGQFTQFLNSDDKDKAAILEKITGVDAYTKIGKKIYEVTKVKEEKWQNAQRAIDGVILLTAEQIEQKRRESKELSDQNSRLMLERSSRVTKLEWINENEELVKQVQQNKAAFESARAKWENEDIVKTQLLVNQWNESIDVRAWLTESIRAAADEIEAKQQIDAKMRDFSACLAAKLQAERQQDADKLSLRETKAALEAKADKAKAIEQDQTIIAHIQRIVSAKAYIEACKKDIAKYSDELKSLDEKLKEKRAAADSNQVAFTQCERAVEEAEKKVASFQINELREQAANIERSISEICLARERLSSLNTAQDKVTKEKEAIAELEEQISKYHSEIKILSPRIEEARVCMEERQAALKLHLATVEKWTKKLRSELVPGELCPVCRQQVVEVPQENILDELYTQAEQSYKNAEKLHKELCEQLCSFQNDLKVHSTLHDKRALALAQDQSVSMAQAALETSIAILNISLSENTESQLDTLETQLKKELGGKKQSIKESEEAEKHARKCRNDLDAARKKSEQAKEECETIQKHMDGKKSDIDKYRSLIAQKDKDITEAEQQVSTLLEGSGEWSNNWHSDAEGFIKELTKLGQEQSLLNEKFNSLNSTIINNADMLQRVDNVAERILQLCPEWRGQAAAYGSINKLEDTIIQLHSEVASLCTRRGSAAERKAERELKVKDYLARNTQYTLELLNELSTYTTNQINSLTGELRQLRTDFDRARSLADDSVQRQTEHERRKPQLSEEDSKEALRLQIQQIEQDQEAGQQRIGAIKQELEENERRRQELDQLLKELDKAKLVFERWSKINKLFGCATGDKFRRIAQSYVLATLIHAANHYMKTLAPRYTLQVQAGSFVISIEDAYQGYARRAVSTISGGESFLVSLSLALALSDIAHQLSVDTLFIDEGFGTLSGEPLTNAINTLRSLQSRIGRHVGIISHVEELQERIPVQIRVEQEGNSSSSKVSVVAV